MPFKGVSFRRLQVRHIDEGPTLSSQSDAVWNEEYTLSHFLESRETLFKRLEQSGFSQRRVCKEERMGRHRLRNAIMKFPGLDELIKERSAAKHTRKELIGEPTRPPWEYAAWRVREDALKRELASERKINKELAHNASVVSATASIVVPWMEANMQLPPVKAPKKPTGDREAIWILLSINDNHFGATFDLDIMGGLNAFSPSICALRIERVCDVVRMWVENYARVGNPVAGIVIAFNGDNFNGSLAHEDTNNYARVVQQAGDIAAIHAQMTWEIAHMVPEVVCVCPGGDNHTRSTKRNVNSGASAATSWSTIYHWSMKAMLKSVKHVRFHIDIDRLVYVQICGKTWGITHGDMMKGGGGSLGFPAYGARRHHDGSVAETVVLAKRAAQDVKFANDMTEAQKLERMIAAIDKIVDYSLIGHFHIDMSLPLPSGKLKVAPSLMGADPFAKDNLRKYSEAAQTFWALHPKRGIIGEHPVHLQSIVEDGPSRYHWGVLEESLECPDDFYDRFVESMSSSS